MKDINTTLGLDSPSLGKYRRMGAILTLFLLFFAGGMNAQDPCDQISFSMDGIAPCEFAARYQTQTDCYIEIRFILTTGEFSSIDVNTADGFMVQQVSPSELVVTHSFGFIPTGNQVPFLFTLPYDLNTSMSVAFLNDCAQIGCEIIDGWPMESCPDPNDASIIGVKYRECGSLPYSNQPVLPDWTIQLLDADSNVIAEQVTDADGNYAFYDLPHGVYIMKEVQQPGWSPSVPVNGIYAVDLAPSQQLDRNFGNCPGCSCDSITTMVYQEANGSDTSIYSITYINTGDYCFSYLEVEISGGQLLDWGSLPSGWTLQQLNANLLQLTPPDGYVLPGAQIVLQVQVSGGDEHIIALTARLEQDGVNCTRAQTFPHPSVPFAISCCTGGQTQGPELAVNGDFSLPQHNAFSTDYLYGIGSPGLAMAVDPFQLYYPFLNFGKNGPNDRYLAVDASIMPGKAAWKQIVNVSPDADYRFCAAFNNSWQPSGVGPGVVKPIVQLWIEDNAGVVVAISPALTLNEMPDVWTDLSLSWTSPAALNGPYTLKIASISLLQFGNDFSVDCISFRECLPPPPCSVSISASPNLFCGSGTLTANPSGSSPYSYQWSHGQNTQSINVMGLPCGSVCSVSVTCADGSMSSASYTVSDNVPPVAVCNPGVGVDLDVNCVYQVSPAFVDGGSTDNCHIQSMSVSPTVLTGCADTIVTLTVTDWCGNTSTCTMGIQTTEGVPPVMTCPPNSTIIGTIGPDGLCTATFSPTPPVATDNCDPFVTVTNNAPTVLQQGPNTITWTATDDCGNQTTCVQIVTVQCDCQCGSFSNLFARPIMGAPSIPLFCGGMYNFGCPNPGQSIPITGKFECQGSNCPATSQISWALTQPNGNVINGTTGSGPYFFLPIMPLHYAQTGTYTLILRGNCGGTDCPPCMIHFTVDCPNPCPCDVPQFQKDVNQGFATALWNNSCQACFSPIALNDCDKVQWQISGSTLAMTNGNQSFCHTFSGAGTYSVTMIVSRKKSNGDPCETFVFTKSVTVTCLIKDPCNISVFPNPAFSQGAVLGGLNSGGASAGWTSLYGDPHIEHTVGSLDEWAILITGHVDSADVLSSDSSVCISKGSGALTVRASTVSARPTTARDARMAVFLNREDSYVFNVFDSETCFRVATLDVTAYDTSWFDLEIPYNLSDWAALDSCGDAPHGVKVKPIFYVFTCFEKNLGGDETQHTMAFDNLCFDNQLVSVKDPLAFGVLRIFPNPNPGTFTVELPEPAKPGITFQITDLTGRLILQQKTEPGSTQQTVRAAELPAGLYFLQVVSEGKVLAIEKFVKQ